MTTSDCNLSFDRFIPNRQEQQKINDSFVQYPPTTDSQHSMYTNIFSTPYTGRRLATAKRKYEVLTPAPKTNFRWKTFEWDTALDLPEFDFTAKRVVAWICENTGRAFAIALNHDLYFFLDGEKRSFPLTSKISTLAWNPASCLSYSNQNGQIYFMDFVEAGTSLKVIKSAKERFCFSMDWQDQNTLSVFNSNGIQQIDRRIQKIMHFYSLQCPVENGDLSWSADNTFLAASYQNHLKVFDIRMQGIFFEQNFNSEVKSFSWEAPFAKKIAVVSTNVDLLNVQTKVECKIPQIFPDKTIKQVLWHAGKLVTRQKTKVSITNSDDMDSSHSTQTVYNASDAIPVHSIFSNPSGTELSIITRKENMLLAKMPVLLRTSKLNKKTEAKRKKLDEFVIR
ncbi:MAG: hypothetical protein CK425_06340 [Parachlamydia sp.]|nr:MAG: hypothetical protein CK425_06340 [Parachlamydia sp.]